MINEEKSWVSGVSWLNGEGTEQMHRERPKCWEGETRLPRETEKQFPRATVNPDSSSPSSPMQPCSTSAPALRHLWDACFLNHLSSPLHTTWVLLGISAPYNQHICQEQQGHQSSWIFEYLPNLKLFDFKWKLGKEKDNILVCHLQSAFIKVLLCHFTKCYIIYFSLSQRGNRSSEKWNTFSKNTPLIDGGVRQSWNLGHWLQIPYVFYPALLRWYPAHRGPVALSHFTFPPAPPLSPSCGSKASCSTLQLRNVSSSSNQDLGRQIQTSPGDSHLEPVMCYEVSWKTPTTQRGSVPEEWLGTKISVPFW